MATVSVVIPCYNHGIYLDEAVRSVIYQSYQDYEIIIVNDGSTDSYTNDLINSYQHKKIRVITTDNQGLPSARNNGINVSKGKYILPLDADDKIGASYLEKAVYVLEHNEKIGIVYCEAEYFGGEAEGKWNLPEYSTGLLLIRNLIFCSAFFRKQLWQDVGGYNANMKYGLEDWDLWLSIIALGYDVYKLPEVLFYYRKKHNSMIDDLSKDKEKTLLMNTQVFINHQNLYFKNPDKLYLLLKQTIEAVNTLGHMATLYIDLGHGINEELYIIGFSSLKQNDSFKMHFDTSRYKGLKGIRFDPVEGQACSCKLKQITIIQNAMKNVIGIYDINKIIIHNGVISEDGEIFFYTMDPQIYIPMEGYIDSIVVEGELRLLRHDQLIQQKDKVIASIHNSFSWKLGRLITWLPRIILKFARKYKAL